MTDMFGQEMVSIEGLIAGDSTAVGEHSIAAEEEDSIAAEEENSIVVEMVMLLESELYMSEFGAMIAEMAVTVLDWQLGDLSTMMIEMEFLEFGLVLGLKLEPLMVLIGHSLKL